MGASSTDGHDAGDGGFPPTELAELAAKAYVYGYPLVYSLGEMAGFTSGRSSLPVSAPWNELAHARELLGPETSFVSPNNDTLYTVAALDLRGGPLALDVPDAHDRYYVLQLVDAWTNNFAYIGRRATGTAAARYLLTAPDWEGETPPGMQLVRCPTGVAMIVGRVQVDGAADRPAVHALQDAFALTPLGADRPAPAGLPEPDPRVADDLRWWEAFRVQLAAFPPPAADAPFLDLAARLGLTATESPYVDPDPGLAEALVAGADAGQATIDRLARGAAPPVNGWTSAMHLFDYNVDHLGLGTIDSPEWRIDDRSVAYATRAAVARAGLWGNHGYEANYEIVYVDEDGDQLDGAGRYELHLEQTPPVDAFWSLTMYSVPTFLLVDNPIGRYSIGDRTPGLDVAADGSLTIYLQHDSPGPGKEANWLPAPPGAFRPIMRMYQPRGEILARDYVLPPIRKSR